MHSHDSNFKLTCGIGGCPRTYANFRSFQKHIRRVHITALDENATTPGTGPPHLDIIDHGSDTHEADMSDQDQHCLKHSSALFLLKTKEKGWVSQVTLDELVSDMTIFMQARLQKLKQEMKSIIHNIHAEASDEVIAAVERSFSKKEITTPFAGLESAHMQKKYFREMNMLVCYVHYVRYCLVYIIIYKY